MKIKNKIITKKQWYLKNIKQILETYIVLENDESYSLQDYISYEHAEKQLTDYIKSNLEEDLSDLLTCIDGVSGSQDEQIGMIEFINIFSDLNLKIEDFRIEKEIFQNSEIGKNYIWNIAFVYKNHEYEYLSSFFQDFIYKNAEKILDKVVNFINQFKKEN